MRSFKQALVDTYRRHDRTFSDSHAFALYFSFLIGPTTLDGQAQLSYEEFHQHAQAHFSA